MSDRGVVVALEIDEDCRDAAGPPNCTVGIASLNMVKVLWCWFVFEVETVAFVVVRWEMK